MDLLLDPAERQRIATVIAGNTSYRPVDPAGSASIEVDFVRADRVGRRTPLAEVAPS